MPISSNRALIIGWRVGRNDQVELEDEINLEYYNWVKKYSEIREKHGSDPIPDDLAIARYINHNSDLVQQYFKQNKLTHNQAFIFSIFSNNVGKEISPSEIKQKIEDFGFSINQSDISKALRVFKEKKWIESITNKIIVSDLRTKWYRLTSYGLTSFKIIKLITDRIMSVNKDLIII